VALIGVRAPAKTSRNTLEGAALRSARAREGEACMATYVHTGEERAETHRDDRGRHAAKPSEIPKRGWLDIAMRVKNEVSRDNVSTIAAGLALYALRAIFPALTAAVSIYGLFASPDQIASHMQSFSGVLPADATKILQDQLQKLSERPQALSLGLALSV